MRKGLVIAASVAVLVVVTMAPDAIAGDRPDPSRLVVRVQGEVTPEGNLRLAVEPGPIATQSITVYSEPSHTTLAILTDRDFKHSAEGEAWLAEIKAVTPDAMVVTTDLPSGAPALQIPGRPATDNRIAVWQPWRVPAHRS